MSEEHINKASAPKADNEGVYHLRLKQGDVPGYVILPGAPEETITLLEQNIAALGPVSQVMDRGVSAEEMLRQVLEGFESEVLERAGVEYRCYCSRERVSRALISLGAKELREMIDQQGSAQLTCQFCDALYDFTAHELEELLRSATS